MVNSRYVNQIIRDWRGYVHYHAQASSRDGQPWVRYWGNHTWFAIWIKFRQHRSALWGLSRHEPPGSHYRHLSEGYMNALDQVGDIIAKVHRTRTLPMPHTFKRVIVASILSAVTGMRRTGGIELLDQMVGRITIDRWRLQRN